MSELQPLPRPTGGAAFAPFDPTDDAMWEAEVAIRAASYPDAPPSIQALRHEESQWDSARHWRTRVIAHDIADGRPVAYVQVGHLPWLHHPQRYGVTAMVLPDARGRGIGGAILEWVEATVAARGGTVIRAEAKADDVRTLAIAAARGYADRQQNWESRLDVAAFDEATFAPHDERVHADGIAICTLAELCAGAPDPAAEESILAEYYALDVDATEDEPSLFPITPAPYLTWRAFAVDGPEALPDATFLALARAVGGETDTSAGATPGARHKIVGLSALFRNLGVPGVLTQGFTAVARGYRGRGIAQSLKRRTVAYARAHGYREIRTWNNSRNAPMLRINEAMGFAKQPAWITLVKEMGMAT